MRYTPGRFRDCPWCHGRGCAACDSEAEKAYKRAFPDGPKPIVSIHNDESSIPELKDLFRNFLGPKENEVSAIASSSVVLEDDATDSATLSNVIRAFKELGVRVEKASDLQQPKESQ